MDSLKDARPWESKEEVAENSDEDHTDDDTDQENSHTFWKRLLEERYLAQQTNSAQELGRGSVIESSSYPQPTMITRRTKARAINARL